ncbi:hypothetical protein LMG26858_01332 [Achromobacter anxifer]|uniref:Uncharacterized protein n=1 Tax=Achromobacter anxifer TaxID=1287737 RepID=A0A6S7DDK8_9BURK|nr:hypothetical protein [Achromobacter anxifer]CAB3843637.1 hypothetical protein LMG26858_01332 [Achromobacter anxifer]
MSVPANFNGQRPVIDPNDAAMLLIDHQSGLFQTVADMPMTELRSLAGVVPMDTGAVAAELQKTWNREDAAKWAEVYTKIFPPYQLLIESYNRAQEVVKKGEQLDSQR